MDASTVGADADADAVSVVADVCHPMRDAKTALAGSASDLLCWDTEMIACCELLPGFELFRIDDSIRLRGPAKVLDAAGRLSASAYSKQVGYFRRCNSLP